MERACTVIYANWTIYFFLHRHDGVQPVWYLLCKCPHPISCWRDIIFSPLSRLLLPKRQYFSSHRLWSQDEPHGAMSVYNRGKVLVPLELSFYILKHLPTVKCIEGASCHQSQTKSLSHEHSEYLNALLHRLGLISVASSMMPSMKCVFAGCTWVHFILTHATTMARDSG